MSVAARGCPAPAGRPSGRRAAGGGPPRLPVGGIVPFTAVDFPGKLAAVFFLQGCPWRCGYCHNPHLQSSDAQPAAEWDAWLDWLDGRRGLLDGAVFSGGEPTAHAGLEDAMRDVRVRGFAVGLHTGCAYPRRLAGALELVEWIGLDVKAPEGDYATITGVEGSGAAAFASLRAVLSSGVAHEVRTTVHPSLLSGERLLRLAAELAAAGVRRWVLQPFRPTGCADAALAASAPRGAIIDRALVDELRERVTQVELRA